MHKALDYQMIRTSLLACCAVFLFLSTYSVGFAQSFTFVIPGDDGSQSVTSQNNLLDAPAGKHGFVRVADDHFFAGSDRIRFWGMNLCFSANFPTHEVSDSLAPHLAKLGVNAVRFHHMDTQSSPNGIWGEVDDNGKRQFDPEMIDRLDYLLAKLHENGIYANLNMHTGRTLTEAEGFPKLTDVPWWANSNKWVTYYDKSVQNQVKQYCRDLLTHKNPYRDNKRRVDDPGLAMVEMLNENYFSTKGYSLAYRLPKRFQDSLVQAWNLWLSKKYESTETMSKAWFDEQPAMGDFVFKQADWSSSLDGWALSKSEDESPRTFNVQPPAELGGAAKAIRITPSEATDKDYHQQLRMINLSVKKDEPLTLTYWVRADAPRPYQTELSTNKDEKWRELAIYEGFEATTQWQKVQRVLFSSETIDNEASLLFSFGTSEIPIEFAGITLQQGAFAKPMAKDQRMEDSTVPVPTALSPVGAHNDMKQFMVETEIAWVRELKSFLTDELGVKVPITASQINYHTAAVNEGPNDFVDLHNYWHHPQFPSGANWDPDRWTVKNDPMEADPTRAAWPANSLLVRMGWRIAGKPMTLTEWNVSEPSYASAGCVPMAAVLGALQDWDAVFFFDYDSQSKDAETWNRSAAINFFDFNGQPIKLASVSVFANVFLRGDLSPLKQKLVGPIDQPINGTLALTNWLGVSSKVTSVPDYKLPDATNLRSSDGSVTWTSTPPTHGLITINTPNTQGFWGTIAQQKCATADLGIQIDAVDPNYGLVVATSNDGQPIAQSKSILLLTATSSKNQNMQWNEERNGVGRNWGNGPTQVAAINGTIHLKNMNVEVFALDGTGKRIGKVPVENDANGTRFSLSAKHQTIWYEVVRK